jgi:hypothetical protein
MKLLILFIASLAALACAYAGSAKDAPPCESSTRPTAHAPLTSCGGMPYAEWIRITPRLDQRPWWRRLRFSLFGEAGIDKARVRADREHAEVSGSGTDADRPRGEVHSFAGGIKVEGDL